MPGTRTKSIIAVFGGSDTQAVAFANRMGAAIADKGQVLLSGGVRAGHTTVKESAIGGAGCASWIGVDRPDPAPAHSACKEVGSGFVISSHLDHKRNYVEAALCDAAIGLAGAEGTRSEVAFALSLHRPVALVGACWAGVWPAIRDVEVARRAAAKEAMRRVGEVPQQQPKLLALLNEQIIFGGLGNVPDGRVRYFGPADNVEPEDVVAWLLKVIGFPDNPQLLGNLPQIEGHEEIAPTYEAWLAANEAGPDFAC